VGGGDGGGVVTVEECVKLNNVADLFFCVFKIYFKILKCMCRMRPCMHNHAQTYTSNVAGKEFTRNSLKSPS